MARGTAVRGADVRGGAVGGTAVDGSVANGTVMAVEDGVEAGLVAAAGGTAPPVPDTAAVAPHPASAISEIVGTSRRITPAGMFILHTFVDVWRVSGRPRCRAARGR